VRTYLDMYGEKKRPRSENDYNCSTIFGAECEKEPTHEPKNKKKKSQTRYDLLQSITRNLNIKSISTGISKSKNNNDIKNSGINIDGDVDEPGILNISTESESSYSSYSSYSDSENSTSLTGNGEKDHNLESTIGTSNDSGGDNLTKPITDIPEDVWLSQVNELCEVTELNYQSTIELPAFPDVDDNSILDSGSPTFGTSLKDDRWIRFSNDYYQTIIEITELSDYWYSLLNDHKEQWRETLSNPIEWDLKRKSMLEESEREVCHPCTLECMTLDPMDLKNGCHICLLYYCKITNASMKLYDRLIQYYLAGHCINIFTRLVKCKEFREEENMEYVPELTTTMSVSLFNCLQKLRLVCRFEVIQPWDIFNFTMNHLELQTSLKKSINYGVSLKNTKLNGGYLYDMDFKSFFKLVDEFTEYWNSCYMDENYHIYVNILLDRIALFYLTDCNQSGVLNDSDFLKIHTEVIEKQNVNKNDVTIEKEILYHPNFRARFKMDLHEHVLLEKLHLNKKYGKMSWGEFQKKESLDFSDQRKVQYFKDLRTFMKLWILYKLQTVNDQLDEDVGNRYQENFVTKFQADWFNYYKREIEIDLTYHSSKTPKILLKQIKPVTCNGIIDASSKGLAYIFLHNRVDPKLRGYMDWLRLYLTLNMFVESCAKIASKDSPYVLHLNQCGVNYAWFQKDKFPFLYYSGGRYHVYYEGCVIYGYDVPYDLSLKMRLECINNSRNYNIMGKEEKEGLLKTIQKNLHMQPDITDDHWYLPDTLSDMLDKLDINNIYFFLEENKNGVEYNIRTNNGSRDGRSTVNINECNTADYSDGLPIDANSTTDDSTYARLEEALDDSFYSMNFETKKIKERLFSKSWTDGDTIYDTILIWICIIFNCMRSTPLYNIIKSGIVKSCEILEERIKHVKKTHVNLKKKLNFISDFKERTKRIECLF